MAAHKALHTNHLAGYDIIRMVDQHDVICETGLQRGEDERIMQGGGNINGESRHYSAPFSSPISSADRHPVSTSISIRSSKKFASTSWGLSVSALKSENLKGKHSRQTSQGENRRSKAAFGVTARYIYIQSMHYRFNTADENKT